MRSKKKPDTASVEKIIQSTAKAIIQADLAQTEIDLVALIHKSNKLIEGKLDDVKRQHRTNIYQVGILTNNIEGLMVRW